MRRAGGAGARPPAQEGPGHLVMRLLNLFVPLAVPLGHGLEHPLGLKVEQVRAVNHDFGEVRSFQTLHLEHDFAHLLDEWDSRSVGTCLGEKMSARAQEGRGTRVSTGFTHRTRLPAAPSGPGTPRAPSRLRESPPKVGCRSARAASPSSGRLNLPCWELGLKLGRTTPPAES